MGFKPKKIEKPAQKREEIKRVIPIDRNNEQFLIGHALNSPDLLEILVNGTDSEAFLFKNHRAIFEAMTYLWQKNLGVNPDSIDAVKNRFRDGVSVRLDYICEMKAIFQSTVSEENYQFHLNKLRDDKVKDVLQLQLMPDFAKLLANPQVTSDRLLEKITEIRDRVEDSYVASDFGFHSLEVVDREHDEQLERRVSGSVFGSTGYEKLDRLLTDGYGETKMTIIAGRPAMGKSSFACNSFLRLGMAGVPVALYNFEMDSISTYDRLVSIKANIPLEKIIKKRNLLTDLELKNERMAKEALRELPIYLYDRATQSIDAIKRDLRILKEKHDVKVVGYDLFDKMKFRWMGNRSTADTLNDGLKTIQNLGREFGVHQVLVVQISRAAEKRKNKRPKLSELKDAGGYEERADNIMFLYRPSYYGSAEEDREIGVDVSEEVEVIIAKQRQGVANVKVMFDFFPSTTCIAEPLVIENGIDEGNSDADADSEN